jgi:DNA transposition AAA+ family ATPase
MNQTTEFIATKEYRRFVEFCNACKKENYIGLCYGPAGVGKSVAAYQFSQWHEVKHELELKTRYIMDYPGPSIKMDDLDSILYLPPVSNSPSMIYSHIKELAYDFELLIEEYLFKGREIPWGERLKQRLKLLIVDEADRLQPKSLEQIRDIYDRQQVAVILIGMPGIEKRLVRFPQLYSRIGFSHRYKPLGEEEIAFIVSHHLQSLASSVTVDAKNFADQEAIAAFTRITQGNFRLINRLLKQTLRIMEVNQLSSITKEVIEAARECLVIGNV